MKCIIAYNITLISRQLTNSKHTNKLSETLKSQFMEYLKKLAKLNVSNNMESCYS